MFYFTDKYIQKVNKQSLNNYIANVNVTNKLDQNFANQTIDSPSVIFQEKSETKL